MSSETATDNAARVGGTDGNGAGEAGARPRLLGRRQVAMGGAALALAIPALRQARAADAFTTMQGDPRFSKWVELIVSAHLEGFAAKRGPYTIFVPVNEAFGRLTPAQLNVIQPRASPGGVDTSQLVFVVRSHVVPGFHLPREFTGKKVMLKSINGFPVKIDGTTPGQLNVTFEASGGHTVGPPIATDNALIYPTDIMSVHYEAH